MKFYDAQGNVFLCENINNLLEENCQYEIFVGTDSKVKRSEKKVLYATCIVLYKKGRGGRILFSREKKKVPGSLRDRLAIETWKSLEVAMELSKYIKNIDIVVHLDVNSSEKHKSGLFSQELVSMVVGQGFKCVIKPDSVAAQSVADRLSKKEIKTI